MNTIRQRRVEKTIQHALAEIIIRELSDPRIRMATVSRVELTADLMHAKVYVSVIGAAAEQRTVFRGICSAGGFIRGELGKRVKMRFLPELHFILDQSVGKAMEISKIIDEVAAERREREAARGAEPADDGSDEDDADES